MYCLKCRYDLQGLSKPHCPECGREFDQADPKTYARKKFGLRLPFAARILLWFIGLFILNSAMFFLAFTYMFTESPGLILTIFGSIARVIAEPVILV